MHSFKDRLIQSLMLSIHILCFLHLARFPSIIFPSSISFTDGVLCILYNPYPTVFHCSLPLIYFNSTSISSSFDYFNHFHNYLIALAFTIITTFTIITSLSSSVLLSLVSFPIYRHDSYSNHRCCHNWHIISSPLSQVLL